ncbi:MAG: prephenate dehydratase [Methanosphaera sp.]|uniref:prephenate dehydratase n=1 Tax=Methanosphaera sp. TaxID=2666342 RepID=UPI0025F7C5FA|nr:prephenate dehydratase [Methanosphaera sp.]MCI5866836.1 prephenate dehydratase [Methanosphaera sp.]MDD6534343.1 prephenate dehydratase [Methanosphaera sp.]MDY3955252.1 prephenate dehydratase [Methanosphaera sp.]
MNKNKQVGYLGPEGTFSHEAAMIVVNNNTDAIKAYPSILSVFEDLNAGNISTAVVPIENSTEGSVSITLDCLTHFNMKIIKELVLPIRHNLLVQKGRTLDDIKMICSHQQPIAQCRRYINSTGKPTESMASTATAARYVTEISTAAVIGNKSLAEKYNLEILDSDIQDYSNNVTRFVILSKDDNDTTKGENNKTSIIISLCDDKPGGLYEILYEFKKENINLTRIESRPSKEGMGKYLFFIDMEGHRLDSHVSRVLKKVEKKVKIFKILGSYETTTAMGELK